MTDGPLQSVDRAELLFAFGAVAVLVAGLLPWLTATEPIPVTNPSERAEGLQSFSAADTTTQVLGIDRVEWIAVAGVGLVAAAVVLTEPWSRVVLGVGGVSAIAALAIGALYLFDPVWMYSDWLNPEIGAVTSVGPGIYLVLVGGALQAVGCSLGARGPATTGAGSLDQSPGERRPPRQEQPARQPQDGQQQGQPRRQNDRRPPQQEQPPRENPQSGQRRSPERETERRE
jgi:hypothetical protein